MAKKKAAAKKTVKKAVKVAAKKKVAKKAVKKSAPKRPAAAAKSTKTKKKVTSLAATKKKKVVAVKTKKVAPKATKPVKKKPVAVKHVVAKPVAPKSVVAKPAPPKPAPPKPVVAPPPAVTPVTHTHAPAPAVTTHHSMDSTMHHGERLTCNWSISDFKATFSESTTVTRFHYVHTNPVDAEVKIGYASSMGGPVDNYIQDQQDMGLKDCSGTPTEWNALEMIPTGYEVSIQLFENGIPMTARTYTIVQSVP